MAQTEDRPVLDVVPLPPLLRVNHKLVLRWDQKVRGRGGSAFVVVDINLLMLLDRRCHSSPGQSQTLLLRWDQK
eukprot:96517-Prorocentrum_minimum.AAC.1